MTTGVNYWTFTHDPTISIVSSTVALKSIDLPPMFRMLYLGAEKLSASSQKA